MGLFTKDDSSLMKNIVVKYLYIYGSLSLGSFLSNGVNAKPIGVGGYKEATTANGLSVSSDSQLTIASEGPISAPPLYQSNNGILGIRDIELIRGVAKDLDLFEELVDEVFDMPNISIEEFIDSGKNIERYERDRLQEINKKREEGNVKYKTFSEFIGEKKDKELREAGRQYDNEGTISKYANGLANGFRTSFRKLQQWIGDSGDSVENDKFEDVREDIGSVSGDSVEKDNFEDAREDIGSVSGDSVENENFEDAREYVDNSSDRKYVKRVAEDGIHRVTVNCDGDEKIVNLYDMTERVRYFNDSINQGQDQDVCTAKGAESIIFHGKLGVIEQSMSINVEGSNNAINFTNIAGFRFNNNGTGMEDSSFYTSYIDPSYIGDTGKIQGQGVDLVCKDGTIYLVNFGWNGISSDAVSVIKNNHYNVVYAKFQVQVIDIINNKAYGIPGMGFWAFFKEEIQKTASTTTTKGVFDTPPCTAVNSKEFSASTVLPADLLLDSELLNVEVREYNSTNVIDNTCDNLQDNIDSCRVMGKADVSNQVGPKEYGCRTGSSEYYWQGMPKSFNTSIVIDNNDFMTVTIHAGNINAMRIVNGTYNINTGVNITGMERGCDSTISLGSGMENYGECDDHRGQGCDINADRNRLQTVLDMHQFKLDSNSSLYIEPSYSQDVATATPTSTSTVVPLPTSAPTESTTASPTTQRATTRRPTTASSTTQRATTRRAYGRFSNYSKSYN